MFNHEFFVFSEPRINTTGTSTILSELKSCESYLISVGIVGPRGPGPLGRNPLNLETEYDEKSPPRNVVVAVDPKQHTMTVSWENNCPLASHNPSYVITLHELTHNTTSTVVVKSPGTKVMEHQFTNIQPGAVFNVSVATKAPGAIPMAQKVFADELDAPRQLKVYPERNGTLVIYWRELNHIDET